MDGNESSTVSHFTEIVDAPTTHPESRYNTLDLYLASLYRAFHRSPPLHNAHQSFEENIQSTVAPIWIAIDFERRACGCITRTAGRLIGDANHQLCGPRGAEGSEPTVILHLCNCYRKRPPLIGVCHQLGGVSTVGADRPDVTRGQGSDGM